MAELLVATVDMQRRIDAIQLASSNGSVRQRNQESKVVVFRIRPVRYSSLVLLQVAEENPLLKKLARGYNFEEGLHASVDLLLMKINALKSTTPLTQQQRCTQARLHIIFTPKFKFLTTA